MPDGNFEKECPGESQEQEVVVYALSCECKSRQSVAMLSPKSQLRILKEFKILSRLVMTDKRIHIPLNFLSGIMESSYLSSSFTITFLLLPSPMTRRVLPQLKSSMHQRE